MEAVAYPVAFLRAMQTTLGEEYSAFERALQASPTAALRLNPRCATAFDHASPYTDSAVPWAADGRYQCPGARPGADIAHDGGAYYIQDASAMAAVAALDPQPGEYVLDLCAAPGGKSTQIADRLQGQGLLLSNEIDARRARILASNIERMGIVNAIVTHAAPATLCPRVTGFFDRVLVDAPCSGEGMMRRDPQARAEWTPGAPEGCQARQKDILRTVADTVAPGGVLVYSTCTFNTEENEEVIADFLRTHPDFAPEDFTLAGVGEAQAGRLRLWPHRVRGEGHFVQRLRRSGSRPTHDVRAQRTSKDALQAREALLRDAVTALPDGQCQLWGDALVLTPCGAPDLTGVHVVQNGLMLARVGRNYIVPEHALAMAMHAAPPRCACEVDDDAARRYLAGEPLTLDAPRGWVVVTWRGLPLGWGKSVDGVVKNHRPKGLRRTVYDRTSDEEQ